VRFIEGMVGMLSVRRSGLRHTAQATVAWLDRVRFSVKRADNDSVRAALSFSVRLSAPASEPDFSLEMRNLTEKNPN
jgi:hypothetical protein